MGMILIVLLSELKFFLPLLFVEFTPLKVDKIYAHPRPKE